MLPVLPWLGRSRLRRTAFKHPLDGAPRTAILSGQFRRARNVRIFPQGWSSAVENYRPAVIVGSRAQIHSLSRLQSVTHAIVVLISGDEDAVAPAERHLLWNRFGVPIFEQWIAPDGSLLAYECEFHEGLHVCAAPPSRCGFALEESRCACGRPGARLIPVEAESPSGMALVS